MGFGVTELLIILAIVLVLFGAKKLRNIGGDLGGAIKNFKTAMKDEENATEENSTAVNQTQLDSTQLTNKSGTTIDATVEGKNKENR